MEPRFGLLFGIVLMFVAYLLISKQQYDCQHSHCRVGVPQVVSYTCTCVPAVPD